MESWVQTATNVIATGNLTQLFPPWCTVGSGLTTQGTLRRQAQEGILYSAELYSVTATGGVIELWDIAGTDSGTSNVDTATVITNAYLVAAIARNEAKLIWNQSFTGTDATPRKFSQRTILRRGLAVRYINTVDGVGTDTISLSIVSEGVYRKVEISG